MSNDKNQVDKQEELQTEGVTMEWLPPSLYDFVVSVFTFGREAKLRREVLDIAKILPGEKVLDIGCGTGTLALMAAEDCKPGSVLGIDATPSYVTKARNKAGARINVRFEEALAESIPADDNTFNVILCTYVLHHLPNPELQKKVLQEMKRVLQPNGRILIVDFPEGDHHHHIHLGFCRGHEQVAVEDDPLFSRINGAGFDQVRAQQVRMMNAIGITAQKAAK